MRAIIEGVVMDLYEQERTLDNGQKVYRKIALVFQKGEKNNVEARVSDDMFHSLSEGEKVSIPGRVVAWAMNGKSGLSFVAEGAN